MKKKFYLLICFLLITRGLRAQETQPSVRHWNSIYNESALDYKPGEEVTASEYASYCANRYNRYWNNTDRLGSLGPPSWWPSGWLYSEVYEPSFMRTADDRWYNTIPGYRDTKKDDYCIFCEQIKKETDFSDVFDYYFKYSVKPGHENDIIDTVNSLSIRTDFKRWRHSPSVGQMCDYLRAKLAGDEATAAALKNLSYLQPPSTIYFENDNMANTNLNSWYDENTAWEDLKGWSDHPFDTADQVVSFLKGHPQKNFNYYWRMVTQNGVEVKIWLQYDSEGNITVPYPNEITSCKAGGGGVAYFWRGNWPKEIYWTTTQTTTTTIDDKQTTETHDILKYFNFQKSSSGNDHACLDLHIVEAN
ncbi:MAG: hypothetical protein K2W99_07075 [Chthoniobacterales bacterium]|nr:hypothetical protein [Chthoniobacterales bacterium]